MKSPSQIVYEAVLRRKRDGLSHPDWFQAAEVETLVQKAVSAAQRDAQNFGAVILPKAKSKVAMARKDP